MFCSRPALTARWAQGGLVSDAVGRPSVPTLERAPCSVSQLITFSRRCPETSRRIQGAPLGIVGNPVQIGPPIHQQLRSSPLTGSTRMPESL